MEILNLFADVLIYPQNSYKENAQELINSFEPDSAESEMMLPFSKYIGATDLAQIEELFTRTFDMNKTACLELGWHLYGEEYKRGEFLVKMRQALEEFHIPESVELPDHMSHCLKLLAVLEEEEAAIFAREYLGQALETIISGFDKDNPYYGLLLNLQTVLKKAGVRNEAVMS